MTSFTKLISMVGATIVVALASTTAPAFADSKPCCYNNGQYFTSTPSTCTRYGGQVLPLEYCRGNYQGNYGGYPNNYGGYPNGYGYEEPRRRPAINFSILLGNIVFAYRDGYYDNGRRWHNWRNDAERNWFYHNRRDRFHDMYRDNDRHRGRREWREGRGRDWRHD